MPLPGEHSDRSAASPLRIASLQPSITLTLQRLGRLDDLVACTRYCGEALPELVHRDIKIIADSWSSTMEELLAVEPNLVIASVPYRMESLAAILRAGCPVLTLAPHTLADIFADIRLIGSVVHASDRAEELVMELASSIEAVRLQSANASNRPRVYCEEWGKPLIHSQPWVKELVEAAGGEFLGDPGKTTTADTVAASDPDILVFAWCGAGDRVPLARVVDQRGWQSLRAVSNGRVYCIPDEFLNTPAHPIVEGLDCLAAAIHPNRFARHPRLISLAHSQKQP
ncbi:MAG TPA: ABC transporter substrate-binding protein [Acidobacteriaceae bacterium]|nr:ABC transporter substrate-binding protein [Acidobacteriaceae bacterium]